MKDQKAKYLIIEASEFKKQLYKVSRKFSFNDFENRYEPKGFVNAKQIFEKNDLPEEFHKIIIKINIPFCLKEEAEEYTMGFPFDITAGKIEKENNKKIITISSSPIIYDRQLVRPKISFKSELSYSNFDDVMNFLQRVSDEGYLKSYLKSIKEFFDISLDLDLLYELWYKLEKNPKHTSKIYKKIK